MVVKRDVILDAIYSAFIAVILFIRPENIEAESNIEIIEIFRGIGAVGIIYLWARMLTKNFNENLFVKTGVDARSTMGHLVKITNQLSGIKVAVLIIGYVFMNFYYSGPFEIRELYIRLIELVLAILYFTAFYLATFPLSEKRNYEWILVFFLMLPFFLLITIHYSFNSPKEIYFFFLPTNSYWIFKGDLHFTNLLCFFLSIGILLFVLLYHLKRFMQTPRKVNLPYSKLN